MTRAFEAWQRLPNEVWVLVIARTVDRGGSIVGADRLGRPMV
jgi:hypothetical protein